MVDFGFPIHYQQNAIKDELKTWNCQYKVCNHICKANYTNPENLILSFKVKICNKLLSHNYSYTTIVQMSHWDQIDELSLITVILFDSLSTY